MSGEGPSTVCAGAVTAAAEGAPTRTSTVAANSAREGVRQDTGARSRLAGIRV